MTATTTRICLSMPHDLVAALRSSDNHSAAATDALRTLRFLLDAGRDTSTEILGDDRATIVDALRAAIEHVGLVPTSDALRHVNTFDAVVRLGLAALPVSVQGDDRTRILDAVAELDFASRVALVIEAG